MVVEPEKGGKMKKTVHRAEERGHADHGWLDSHHSFSFAGYYDPEKMNFGALRVLNDDIVSSGMGFGTHPHENMEIISIPLSGSLKHKDSMGNIHVIRENEVQVMSAGTGIQHSEFNPDRDKEVNFLQIWIFPDQRDVEPRYDQKEFDPKDQENRFQQILGSTKDGGHVWIHQNARMFRGRFSRDMQQEIDLSSSQQGIYLFVLEGAAEVAGESLGHRDAIGISAVESIQIEAKENSDILIIEVPMD